MKKNPVIYILLGALIVRIGFIIPLLRHRAVERLLRPDSFEYIRGAWSLAQNFTYSVTSRPPGTSLFFALFFQRGAPVLAVALCFISAAVVYLVYLAVKECAGEKCALAGAGFAAFNITAVVNAPLLLSDTLFSLFAALEFLAFIIFVFRENHRKRYAFLAAVIGGAACLIRPINILHVAVLPVLTLFCPEIKWKKKVAVAAIEVLLFALIVVPWMLFNYSRGAGFAVDTNTGAMYHQNGAMLLAEVNGSDFETEKSRLLEIEKSEFADQERYPDMASQEKFRISEYLKLLKEHPWIALRQQLFNYRILVPDLPTALELLGVTTPNRGTMSVAAKSGLVAAAKHYFGNAWRDLLPLAPFIIIYIEMFIYIAIALYRTIREIKNKWYFLLLLGGFGLYYLWLPGAITAPRYQLPALPVLALFAALGAPRKKAAKTADAKVE